MLYHLRCPRITHLASLCLFGKMHFFLKYCARPASPGDASSRWWCLSGSEAPLVSPRRTTPLWVCHVLGYNHIELEEKGCGRGTRVHEEVPMWSILTASLSQHPPQQGDNSEGNILPTPGLLKFRNSVVSLSSCGPGLTNTISS